MVSACMFTPPGRSLSPRPSPPGAAAHAFGVYPWEPDRDFDGKLGAGSQSRAGPARWPAKAEPAGRWRLLRSFSQAAGISR